MIGASWIEMRAAEILAQWRDAYGWMPYPKHIADGSDRLGDVTPAEAAGWFMHMDGMTPASRHAWAGWLAREMIRG